MSHEDFEIVTGYAVCVSVQGKPSTANGIIDDDVASWNTAAGLKIGKPRIVSRLNRTHIGLSNSGVGRPFQSNRHPRVVGEVGIDREEQAVDAIGYSAAEQGVVKSGGSAQYRWVYGITGHRGHEVIAVGRRGINASGAIPGQVRYAEGADQEADVF